MTNLEMNRNIADFIGRYCSKWNISASKFAEKCGVPYMTIKRILSCNVQKIDVCTVTRIARATRTPMMEILNIETENPELYRRFFCATAHDREILVDVMNILDKLHMSGRECREIPYMVPDCDRISYIIHSRLLCPDGLNLKNMERITFRSSFTPGMNYLGFQLPDNALCPHYLKGNILLVVNENPGDGDLGAYAWKEQGYVRLIFRRVRENGHCTELIPINNRGRKYLIDNDNVSDLMHWVPLGVVVGIIR